MSSGRTPTERCSGTPSAIPARWRSSRPTRRSACCSSKQFRPAANETLLEIPAGTLEKGEAPLACAKRELIEEIGFAAKKWKEIRRCVYRTGFCSERFISIMRGSSRLRARKPMRCDGDDTERSFSTPMKLIPQVSTLALEIIIRCTESRHVSHRDLPLNCGEQSVACTNRGLMSSSSSWSA